jgi:hypothetical protein
MPNETLTVAGPIAFKLIAPSAAPGATFGWAKLYGTKENPSGTILRKFFVRHGSGARHQIGGYIVPLHNIPVTPWSWHDYATYGLPKQVATPANDEMSLNGAAEKSTTGTNVIMTLDANFRPAHQREFVCPARVGGVERLVRLTVAPDGDVTWAYTYDVGPPGPGDILEWVVLTPVRYDLD